MYNLSLTIETTAVTLFLLLNLAVGVYYSRGVNSLRLFAVGDRNFSTLSIACTIVATYISGDLFITYVSETYKEGLFFVIAALSGVICLLSIGWVFGPRMKEFFGDLSVAETMGRLYGRKVRVITALSSIGIAVGMTSVQIKVFSTLFNHYFSFSSSLAIIASSLIVIFYSALGGINSVVFTDILQFLTFSVFIPMFVLFLLQGFTNIDQIILTLQTNKVFDYHQLVNSDNPRFLPNIFLLFWCLIPSFNSAMYQRILIAKDTAQIRSSFSLAALLCLIILCLICFIGLILLSINPEKDPNNIILHAIDICNFPGLKTFALIGIIAMVMSTADSWINTTAIIIAHDLSEPFGFELKKSLNLVRISSILVGFFALFLALSASSLLELALLSANFYMPIVTVPLIFSLLGFRTTTRVILLGMITGIITILIWKYQINKLTEINSVVPAMIMHSIALISAHYLLREPGGWIGKAVYDEVHTKKVEPYRIIKNRVIRHLYDTIIKVKEFDILSYLNNRIPTTDNTFIYFAIGGVISLLGTIFIRQDLYIKNAIIISSLQGIIFLISSIFIFLKIWPVKVKNLYIGTIWHLSIFMLGLVSTLLLVVSQFSELQLIIFFINYIILALLLSWKEGIAVLAIHLLITLPLGINLFIDNYNKLALSIVLKLVPLSTVLIFIIYFYIKPLQEKTDEEKMLRKKFQKLYQELEKSYRVIESSSEQTIKLQRLLDKKSSVEKNFIRLMNEKLKLLQVKNIIKNKNLDLGDLPIIIQDEEITSINFKECLKEITDFIGYSIEKQNINLHIDCQKEEINIGLGKASVYQVIYSLIVNIVDLLPKQSKLLIKDLSNVDLFKIDLEYNGYGLSREDIIRLTKNKKHINPFLLNWKKLFEVLGNYNIEINIVKKENGGKIYITKTLNTNVYKISDYRRKSFGNN
ncbi:MAG: sodium:solute symporter family protein [Rickettsiaceae bacterium]|jgi:Na+/proline symporter/arsenate reductase-like glutaredoxin family protein|nr:sodium:solute symporter family protein [Rickettsiaceae bacterium]